MEARQQLDRERAGERRVNESKQEMEARQQIDRKRRASPTGGGKKDYISHLLTSFPSFILSDRSLLSIQPHPKTGFSPTGEHQFWDPQARQRIIGGLKFRQPSVT